MNLRRLTLVLQILLVSACSHGDLTRGGDPLNDQVDKLVRQLQSGKVGKIEVVGIPASVVFVANATPDVVETAWQYRITVRNIDGERLDNLVLALKEARPERDAHFADLRVGVIFYSSAEGKQEERLCSLFFNRTGSRGALNGVPVAFGGGLYRRLTAVLFPPYK